MTMNPKAWIATAALLLTSTVSFADPKNEVRAVSFNEEGGITHVHVKGAQTPTFTVYKLERPTRVVVDLPQARLADVLRGHEGGALFSPNTWGVSTIAAQQLDDGAVRVIVTLARPGRYDVKTDGNEVDVMVMPRDPAPKVTNPAELEQAKRQAQAAEQARKAAEKSSEAANATARQSKAEAETAKAEAERLRVAAAQQAAKAEAAQRAVEEAKQAAAKNASNAADLERARRVAAAANDEAARAKAQAAKASREAEQARGAAQLAQIEADKMKTAAEQARRDALAEAAAAKADAEQARAEMAKAKSEVARAQAEAQAQVAKSQAQQAQLARSKAEAQAQIAKSQAEAKRLERQRADAEAQLARAQADARAQVAHTKAEADQLAKARAEAQAQLARTKAEAEQLAKAQAEAQAQLARTKAEADRLAKSQADAQAQLARSQADLAKSRAEADAARREAQQTRAQLETQMTAARTSEAKARQAVAAAQAREDAAREAASQAKKEKQLAEAVAKRAHAARDRADTSDATTRDKLIAEAKAAEDRLAKARQATAEAEIRRKTAEQLATAARQDLEHSRTALQDVEQQRVAAVAAARSADEQRAVAESAAKAADKQRRVAEAAARDAMTAKQHAEESLAQLTRKREAAERAAQTVAARTKAEAAAQAEMESAKARKASDDEIAAARREVARLAKERARAESELAERRTAVATQQAEATRLESQAQVAREAAAREDARRTQLAQQRETEERELATLKAQKASVAAATAKAQVAGKQATEKREAEERELAKLEAKRVQAQLAQNQQRTTQAPKPATPSPAKVNNVTFKGNDTSGTVELAVAGEANIELGQVSARTVELIVDNAELAQRLERTLDVSKFGSPVKKVSAFRDRRTQKRVRLIAELASPAIPTVVREGNTVRWRFASNDVARRTRTTKATNIPPTVIGGFGAASTPVARQSVAQLPGAGNRRRTYYGQTVEFDFKDAPIHDLLRIIADTGGVNIVVPDTIDAKVTVRLKRVPWDQALEVILASHGLWYRREGNLYRIAPRKELDAEDEAEAARRAAMVAAEAPKPEVVTLNYASADELKSKLDGMLSPKGKIEVDGRTNSLIINDVAGNRESIARLALQLDTETPQITIEARIVEAQSTYVRQFGIQWGGRALAGAAGGNATGLIFPSSIGLVGGNTDNQTPDGGITALPSDFAINLPAATGTGEGGAIGMSLGSVGGNFNINLRLSALEDTGTVRIVSAPKITVLNNKAALIRSGVSIPISVVSAAGTQTQFVQADLKLEVTPYVSQRDCRIAMNLDVTKNEPDFVNVGARGDPTILRREARTTMLVGDGETTVLGGIYTRNSGLAYKKVPFLGDLPVIGWLFKNRRENDNRTEILVFITPKITNKASLRCVQ